MNTNTMKASGLGWLFSLTLFACGAEGSREFGDEPTEAALAQANAQLFVELGVVEPGTAKLEYKLINPGQAQVRFLGTDTAIKGAFRNLFDVRRAGKPVAYIGPRVDFAAPTEASFVELESGASATRVIDLARLYELTEPGDYTVNARARTVALFAEGPSQLRAQLLVPASELTLAVDETALTEVSAAAQPAAAAGESVEKAIQPECVSACEQRCLSLGDPGAIGQCISSCSPGACNPRPSCDLSKDLVLNTVSNDARRMARDSLSAIDTGSVEYATWFGVELASRRAFVRSALTFAISDIFEGEQVCGQAGDVLFEKADGDTVGCAGPGVDDPANAATGGPMGQNVVFCQSFFGFAADHQAGVMVHEAVHHAGVEDVTDGHADDVLTPAQAQNLAAVDAEAAVRSGENYENFVMEFF